MLAAPAITDAHVGAAGADVRAATAARPGGCLREWDEANCRTRGSEGRTCGSEGRTCDSEVGGAIAKLAIATATAAIHDENDERCVVLCRRWAAFWRSKLQGTVRFR